MKTLKCIAKAFVTALILILATGCEGYGDIAITTGNLVSMKPKGLKSVDLVIGLGIHNPVSTLKLSEIGGVVRVGEKEFISFTTDDLEIKGKSDQMYKLPCSGTLCDNVSLFDVLNFAANLDFSQIRMDVSCRAKHWTGITVTKDFKDINVGDMLKDYL